MAGNLVLGPECEAALERLLAHPSRQHVTGLIARRHGEQIVLDFEDGTQTLASRATPKRRLRIDRFHLAVWLLLELATALH